MYGKYGEIIEIKYTTNSGKGCMTLNVENFLPCNKKDLNFILKKIIPLAADCDRNEIIQKMKSCCVQIITEANEQKDLLPDMYLTMSNKLSDLKLKVLKCEQVVENINRHLPYVSVKIAKELKSDLKKAKHELKEAKSEFRTAETKRNDCVRTFKTLTKVTEKCEQNINILYQYTIRNNKC